MMDVHKPPAEIFLLAWNSTDESGKPIYETMGHSHVYTETVQNMADIRSTHDDYVSLTNGRVINSPYSVRRNFVVLC